MTLLISTTIDPFKFINFANTNAHWSLKRKIKVKLNHVFYLPNITVLKRIDLPIVAKIIRISPRTQDFDNFAYNSKCIRDFIADCIIPGLAPGQADSNPKITWQYQQIKGKPKQHALRIEIWNNMI